MIGPLSYLDAALLALCFISGLLAMYRGFAREVLSILSWIAAGVAVLLFVRDGKKFAQDIAQQMGVPELVAQIAIGALIFLLVLIVVHLITSRLSDAVLDSRVGMIDRVLGFSFGVVRGFALVVIPFMLWQAFFGEPEKLPGVQNSQSLPYIKAAGEPVKSFLARVMASAQSATSTPPPEAAPQP